MYNNTQKKFKLSMSLDLFFFFFKPPPKMCMTQQNPEASSPLTQPIMSVSQDASLIEPVQTHRPWKGVDALPHQLSVTHWSPALFDTWKSKLEYDGLRLCHLVVAVIAPACQSLLALLTLWNVKRWHGLWGPARALLLEKRQRKKRERWSASGGAGENSAD